MIDIESAKKEILTYTQKDRIKNTKVQTKVEHMMRVSEISKRIASDLTLKQEQIKVAELIGLLHDIGRFEQYKISNKESTMQNKEKKFDHGEAGVRVLEKNNYIRKYIKDTKYDNIIYKAVYEHNKYLLSKGLSEEELLFCKIVKDADKIDLLYEAVYKYWQEPQQIKEVENGKLSEKMLEDFNNKRLANSINAISQTYQILRFASFVFDINYGCSFTILKEDDNISKMIDRFNYKIIETDKQMRNVKKIANEYIRQKTN